MIALRIPHCIAIKRILHYLHGTLDYGLELKFTTKLLVNAFADGDWTSYPDDRNSTSRIYVF